MIYLDIILTIYCGYCIFSSLRDRALLKQFETLQGLLQTREVKHSKDVEHYLYQIRKLEALLHKQSGVDLGEEANH